MLKLFTPLLLLCCAVATAQYNIIPLPQQIQHGDTNQYFALKHDMPTLKNSPVWSTLNTTYDTLLGNEGYQIHIDNRGIEMKANTPKGIYYASHTLDQMGKPDVADPHTTNYRYCTITDYPKYAYRGMHLDVCRHFFGKETIERFLDEMVKCKLNYFHWHLTDDQGWRIEIKQYPKLTEAGAWRTDGDGNKYGGYYTQEDIKEIVAYARDRNITIVPEIEMPGHASAAVAAYPWLSCAGNTIQVPAKWGIMKDIYCPTDSTFQFLKNVLDEVCVLFPGQYIHIGGDEVPKAQWKASPAVRQLKADKGLKSYGQVQHYFMQQMETYLKTKGKQSIGWGEVVRGGLSDSMAVMSWRGRGAGIKAAKHGNPVIMAPRFSCYFDYPQSHKERKPAWWMTYLPLKKVYKFSPAIKHNKKLNPHVLGGEATLWTEYVPDEDKLWRKLKPRIAAMGEALWGSPKNLTGFYERLSKQ